MNKLKIIPLILCGGKGTRLWPLSRQSYPKQFLSLYGDNEKSLLQKTYERISNIKEIQDPIIICNEEHRFLVAEQMRNINVKPKAIILEPEGRNTAPAIALGAFKAIEEDEDSILLVLSADHIIKDVELFVRVLREGFKSAEENKLVTFGVIPNRPEIGYGYIESESNLDKTRIKGSKIIKFIEKPNQDLANTLLESKRFTWNSGMFVFKTKVIIDELHKYAPLILDQCNKAMHSSKKDLDFIRIDKSSFLKSPDLPIDVAVMEKTFQGVVIPLDAGWSDIGSWKSLWDSEKKDSSGNVIKGKVVNEDTNNCYLNSPNRVLVTMGLRDLIVVETPDAILVANKEYVSNIKSIVSKLELRGFQEGTKHRKIYRPWGNYTSLIEDKSWQVKIIEVKPNESLSLQLHNHRAEHWVVVKGKAKVQINEKTFTLIENQSTFIPVGAKHRLSNPGEESLILIEVQSGDYLGEDDIIRFDDYYGRNRV